MDSVEVLSADAEFRAGNSPEIRQGIKDILLQYAGLWEALRARTGRAEQV